VIAVPVSPFKASTAFEREVIMADFPGACFTNIIAALIFGNMLPERNVPRRYISRIPQGSIWKAPFDQAFYNLMILFQILKIAIGQQI
jgi:NADH:ubiquinone oxidoreductase subunit 3 (subunit A)